MSPVPASAAEWLELVRENQRGLWAETARVGGGEVLELDGGVLAAIVPASPDRSVFNSVLYRDPDALISSLDRLADAYERAGVRAWTVWVPEDETDTARALEDAGHVLDAVPRAMGAEIGSLRLNDAFEAGQRAGLGEADGPYEMGKADAGSFARLNETAYDLAPGDFSPIGAGFPAAASPRFALHDGEPVSCVMGWDEGDDCEICWVATHPDHRGRGLAGALMAHELRAAADRGRLTTTLQATKAGRPVYERLGYGDFGALHMWERRAPA